MPEVLRVFKKPRSPLLKAGNGDNGHGLKSRDSSPDTNRPAALTLESASLAKPLITRLRLQDCPSLVEALIDSGAMANFVSKRVLDFLGLGSMTYAVSPRPLVLAAKTTLASPWVSRGINLDLSMRSWRDKVEFYVVEGLHRDMILGLPFIQEHSHFINWKTLEFDPNPGSLELLETTTLIA